MQNVSICIVLNAVADTYTHTHTFTAQVKLDNGSSSYQCDLAENTTKLYCNFVEASEPEINRQ